MSEQSSLPPITISAEETITIADRFRGPPQSGNGGYVAGTAANLLNTTAPVEVTLRSPIPLDMPLSVLKSAQSETQQATITQGETLIAEVKASELELDVPEPPDWDTTLKARSKSPAFMERINPLIPDGTGFHPICFCCGADHDDGLQVYAAPVQEGAQVAAIWNTKSEWAETDGALPKSFLWTALDCPGQFAFMAADIITGMLGRMTACVHQTATAGQDYLVTGWRIGIEGKKHFAGTAIFDRDNNLIASAKSIWIGSRPSFDSI